MLAHIGCYCKIMVFSPLKYSHILSLIQGYQILNIRMPLKCTVKMGITAQNMP